MIVTFSVGSKCAVMLPQEVFNQQLTPAKGMVINRLLDSSTLVLVEEVWQFKGFPDSPLNEMCFPGGDIRKVNWGWQEVPNVIEEEYLIINPKPFKMMMPSEAVLEALIKRSIADFKRIKGL